MIEVTSDVPVYEENGVPVGAMHTIQVVSHRTNDAKVLIKMGERSVTVLAADLRAAIANATNRGGR